MKINKMRMIVKVLHKNVSQSTTKTVQEDLQKLEDKIKFTGERGILVHDIKYQRIQKHHNQHPIVAFVHYITLKENTGKVARNGISKVLAEK